jgi:uncharacterized protein YicC (UPF0701 family)
MPEVRINQDLLRELIAALTRIPLPERIAPATFDGLLALSRALSNCSTRPYEALVAMRQSEGGALALVLSARLEKIAALTQRPMPARPASPRRSRRASRNRLLFLPET